VNAPLLTPGERLTLSRERLRSAIEESAKQPDSPFEAFLTGRSGLLDVLKTVMPGTGDLLDALGAWWEHATLRPLAQRHPVALVAGALVAGAILAWSRPWRWLFRPTVIHTLGPALLTSILASGQVQAWILAILSKAPAKPASEGNGEVP
jgi:hypothetical protein